jgi:hypothetical protein
MKTSSVSGWKGRLKGGREDVQEDPIREAKNAKDRCKRGQSTSLGSHIEDYMLFGSADKVAGICSEEKTRTVT